MFIFCAYQRHITNLFKLNSQMACKTTTPVLQRSLFKSRSGLGFLGVSPFAVTYMALISVMIASTFCCNQQFKCLTSPDIWYRRNITIISINILLLLLLSLLLLLFCTLTISCMIYPNMSSLNFIQPYRYIENCN